GVVDRTVRPLTHDLLHTLLGALQGTVERVNITGVHDGTYLAELHLLRSDGQQVTIDARPSDALALALRAGAPVWAHSSLLQVDGVPSQEVVAPLDAEALRAHLRGLGPEDFGKFTP
ncbi:MAG: bifunctional nuclease domain-containing protein, partial [Gemmatimonadales bacterium]|nr:bifunctional nuclease domain-containing protein [Gemmatimonadales bacterium]